MNNKKVTNAIGYALQDYAQRRINDRSCPRKLVIKLSPLAQKWEPDKYYNKQEVATIYGQPMRCTESHTSNQMFDHSESLVWKPIYANDAEHALPFLDLEFIADEGGAVDIAWAYKHGNCITFFYKVYRATKDLILGSPIDDPEAWELVSDA